MYVISVCVQALCHMVGTPKQHYSSSGPPNTTTPHTDVHTDLCKLWVCVSMVVLTHSCQVHLGFQTLHGQAGKQHCIVGHLRAVVGWAWGNLQTHSCFSLMSPDSLSLRVRQNGSTHIDLLFSARKGRRCLSLDMQTLTPGFLVVNICLDITRLWDLLLSQCLCHSVDQHQGISQAFCVCL